MTARITSDRYPAFAEGWLGVKAAGTATLWERVAESKPQSYRARAAAHLVSAMRRANTQLDTPVSGISRYVIKGIIRAGKRVK